MKIMGISEEILIYMVKFRMLLYFLLNLSLVLQFRLDSIETRRVRKVNGELMHNIGANILDPS
jgi:hypothetical protein